MRALTSDGHTIALKVYRAFREREFVVMSEAVSEESRIMTEWNHPCVVKGFGMKPPQSPKSNAVLAMEFMEDVSVEHYRISFGRAEGFGDSSCNSGCGIRTLERSDSRRYQAFESSDGPRIQREVVRLRYLASRGWFDNTERAGDDGVCAGGDFAGRKTDGEE
jgi:hypothetical protein